jgi:crotonobetainyl-CoA:carnitine CoA-transferase CaiB-like acyl-CoA transferase
MSNAKPLNGVKILELSSVVTASLATMILCDQGAEVIKVEPTGIGDSMRHLGTQKGGFSAIFSNCNRGKQSLNLNLKDQDEIKILLRLVKESDVFISNYRPGVNERLGLGLEALRKINPALIYVSISGFGESGPLSSSPAYDHIIQGMSGATSIQSADGKPAYMKTLICDKITGYTACQALTAALFKRERTGETSHISLSMLDSAIFFLWPDGMMNETLLDNDVKKAPPLSSSYSNLLPAKDGFFTIAAMTDNQWYGIFDAIQKPELKKDARFIDAVARSQNMKELLQESLFEFQSLTVEEALEALRANDVPCSPYVSREEVINQPQVIASKTIFQMNSPHQGKLNAVSHPAIFDGHRFEVTQTAPALGEDRDQIIKKLSD